MGRKRGKKKSPPAAAKKKARGEAASRGAAATRTDAGSSAGSSQDVDLGDACPYGLMGKTVMRCLGRGGGLA